MLNLNDLWVFMVAAEHSSFSEAARKLNLSQPAISQKIENLEKYFASRLFSREGRSVILTEVGQELLPMAQELIASANRLEETMASLHGEVIGEMQIGCSTASGKYLLPRLVAGFRRLYPLVRINILISSRKSVVNMLLSGEAAFGVSSKQVEHRDLEFIEFFNDEIILIVPSNHPWANYRNIYPEDLLDEPIILREEYAGTREVMMDALLAQDISPDMLNVTMVLGNAEAIVMAVSEGIGVAFISRLAAARDLEMGRVVEVDVRGMSLRRNLYLARCRRIPKTRAQEEFWEFVHLGEHLPVPMLNEPIRTPSAK